jgi:hypothetical protein
MHVSVETLWVKPRMAHYISYILLELEMNYMDIWGNSWANTCREQAEPGATLVQFDAISLVTNWL